MQWRDAVLSSLRAYSQRRATRVVHRQAFIAEEMDTISSATQSQGATPTQTLSRVLQDLRDEGTLEFLDPGTYLLLDVPINVETEELTEEAIDAALRANRLKIGIVPTDTQQAIVRQRRGQARLRGLTIVNYGSCCAVCDIADSKMLVASHIVGWAEAPEHRGDLANVICLCRIHDALFEAGYWSLDDSLGLLKKPAGSKVVSMVLDVLTVFRSPLEHPPAQRFIRRHRERVGFGA
jgi:hypothetical protein